MLTQAPELEAGWPAVQRLWRHLLGGRQPSCEQAPAVPGEIAEGWKAVLAALGVGALNGGLRQWEHEKQRAMQTLLVPRPLTHRKLTPKVASLLRLSDAALRSGLAWGGLMALGLGVHALCVVYRGRRMWGVDGAAAAAAASAVVHHLSRSPRTWPLPKPVKGHLQGMAWTFFFLLIAAVVLDECFGLAEADGQRKAEAAAKEAAAEVEKQQRADAAAAAQQHDAAAELLAQLEAARRGKAVGSAAAEPQLDERQQQKQPG
ncbi:hypothetical protein COHA_002023 [Chlorella ohadii]|uniref:Uncharacterized protein n=1 Tax=Chlorella ohadii TaxID=2649997 RepID=A0AAD5H8E1_9CHLO|nr:hypothetical protein COHA_010831 [Chlorella ohadii]KAI7844430.1 hypothetical protein COHA_002023 [Chlorella ohadii]